MVCKLFMGIDFREFIRENLKILIPTKINSLTTNIQILDY